MHLLGVDIGGTKCALSLGLAEADTLTIRSRREFATAPLTPQQVLEQFLAEIDRTLADFSLTYQDISGIGISCGGPLDARRGVILSPPNLPGWDEIHATEFFEKATGIPTRLQNDANACAIAEWKYGAGRGTEDMVFCTFGTGYGAGLILGGRLHSGASDMAGEIGHVRLRKCGPIGYGKEG